MMEMVMHHTDDVHTDGHIVVAVLDRMMSMLLQLSPNLDHLL
jgi:hypothetical protein